FARDRDRRCVPVPENRDARFRLIERYLRELDTLEVIAFPARLEPGALKLFGNVCGRLFEAGRTNVSSSQLIAREIFHMAPPLFPCFVPVRSRQGCDGDTQ